MVTDGRRLRLLIDRYRRVRNVARGKHGNTAGATILAARKPSGQKRNSLSSILPWADQRGDMGTGWQLPLRPKILPNGWDA